MRDVKIENLWISTFDIGEVLLVEWLMSNVVFRIILWGITTIKEIVYE